MKIQHLSLITTLAGSLLIGQSAIAADYQTSLGLGAGMAPDYEGSEDYQAVPILFARVGWQDGKYIMLRGNQIKWNMINDQIEFGPLLQYRAKRGNVHNNQVDDMKNVDAAVEAGAFLTGRFGPWSTTLEFAADVSDEHNGYLVTLGGAYEAAVSEAMKMTFGVSTTYASSNYMETYFQVDNGNRGSSNLSNHKANDGELKDVGFSIAADYSINQKWSMVTNLGYKYLLNDAKDSPIVDDEGSASQFFLGLTGIYHF